MLKKYIALFLVFILFSSVALGTISSMTISSPTDDPYYTTNTTPAMTFTGVSNTTLLNASIWGNFSGTWGINTTNTTDVTSGVAFTINTGVLADGYYNWTGVVCDIEHSCTQATYHTVIVDTTVPSIGALTIYNYSTATGMSARVNSTITETNIVSACWAKIFDDTTTLVSTVGGSVVSKLCSIDLTGADIDTTGTFKIVVGTNDSLGNTAVEVNSTNWTKTIIYDGWNLILADKTTTLKGVADLSGTITSTSIYSNALHTYTTYIEGAITNNATAVTDGDAVYVYSNATASLLRNWIPDVPTKNITIISGWNQIALQNSTTNTLGQICGMTLDNATVTMSYATFVDMSASSGSRYISHPCALSINSAKEVPKGYGVWVNVNGTTTMGIARS
ncbi:MAG: hypothetical protein K0A90_00210 [Methanosarcinaceae archaeon]|nr:hypothetical protein [Methanosarcinaceae archaeon]